MAKAISATSELRDLLFHVNKFLDMQIPYFESVTFKVCSQNLFDLLFSYEPVLEIYVFTVNQNDLIYVERFFPTSNWSSVSYMNSLWRCLVCYYTVNGKMSVYVF